MAVQPGKYVVPPWIDLVTFPAQTQPVKELLKMVGYRVLKELRP
jgi:hypothetical protein